MKVKDLLRMAIDIDVYDNVTEELGIAFCGPLKLTEEGEKKFAEVIEYDIEMKEDYAVIDVDTQNDEWKRKLHKAKEFFYSAAGYCASDDYDKWFFDEVE